MTNISGRSSKQARKSAAAVSVYDGNVRIGDVIERGDDAFDAFDSTGKLVGTFASRIEAARAIPTRGAA